MIGSLTIEKANLNISYMLASLKILNEFGGVLSRAKFISEMAKFMGISSSAPNGGENRVPYNKTKFDRYFGFIDVAHDGSLMLTPRGKRMLPCIREKADATSPDAMYEIDPALRFKTQELFLDSCCFDSFGSYNCGAETSNSDVEPPRVILKSIETIGEMTKWELGYVLWGLDAGAFDSFSTAMRAVADNRSDLSFDYTVVIDSWDKSNFVKDFKMVDLFADENVGLIKEMPDGRYCLADGLSQEAKNRIANMSPISAPIQMVLSSNYSRLDMMKWIRMSVLGRIADSSVIFECDLSEGAAAFKQVFADAINAAYLRRRVDAVDKSGTVSHMNSTVALIVKGLIGGAAAFDTIVPGLPKSFARKRDFVANDHGWSSGPGRDHELYDMLVKGDAFATRFGQDNVVLPANLNIIGVK